MKTEYYYVAGCKLTRYQMRIIALLCMGLDRRNMSLRMKNKVGTLKNEITKIFKATQTTKSTELVIFAILNGFDQMGNFNGESML